jgi:hypothetical protein
VTPSGWASSYKVAQINSIGNLASSGSYFDLVQNAYTNTGGQWTYQSTAPTTLFRQSNGLFYWYNAPSGAAGTAATFTQAMTLDASGNLALAMSPTGWGSNYKAFESFGNSAVVFAGANVNGATLSSNAYADNTNWYYRTTGTASRYAVYGNVHAWYNAPSGTAFTPFTWTQVMTLDGSGNLGIATTTPGYTLDVNGNGNIATNLRVGGNITAATWNGATIGIAYGGTNSTATPTAGGVPYGTGTAYAFTTAGTAGQILQSNGAGAPTWVNAASIGSGTAT